MPASNGAVSVLPRIPPTAERARLRTDTCDPDAKGLTPAATENGALMREFTMPVISSASTSAHHTRHELRRTSRQDRPRLASGPEDSSMTTGTASDHRTYAITANTVAAPPP